MTRIAELKNDFLRAIIDECNSMAMTADDLRDSITELTMSLPVFVESTDLFSELFELADKAREIREVLDCLATDLEDEITPL